MDTIGERIKKVRLSLGLTQKKLGELCGIAEPTIRRYELGKLNPKIGTLNKIAKALGVPVTELDSSIIPCSREVKNLNKSQIRKSLTEQLNEMGAKVAHFEDLINDYLALYDVKNQLIKDIKDRGVTYTDYSAAGVAMQKNNPSTKDLVSVNRQMLAILKDLGVSTTNIKKPEDNDEL